MFSSTYQVYVLYIQLYLIYPKSSIHISDCNGLLSRTPKSVAFVLLHFKALNEILHMWYVESLNNKSTLLKSMRCVYIAHKPTTLTGLLF